MPGPSATEQEGVPWGMDPGEIVAPEAILAVVSPVLEGNHLSEPGERTGESRVHSGLSFAKGEPFL